MASPEWFFSTLAQSTAAIIGFVIAFSAVLYQLERQQRIRRTDRLRRELSELKETYKEVILTMTNLFVEIEGASSLSDYLEDTDSNMFELIDQLENDPDIDYPQTALMGILLSRTHQGLSNIQSSRDPQKDNLLSKEQFQWMRQTLESLNATFTDRKRGRNRIFEELNPGYENPAEPLWLDIFGEIDNDDVDSNPRTTSEAEDMYSTDIGEWIFNQRQRQGPVTDPHIFGGKNVMSMYWVISDLGSEFKKAESHRHNTLLDYKPDLSKKIIIASGALALVGVFFPIALLLTLPPGSHFALTGWRLVIVEATALILSMIGTGVLLYIILSNVGGS